MFGIRNKRKIEDLQYQLNTISASKQSLEREFRKLTFKVDNPPKFKRGDKVIYQLDFEICLGGVTTTIEKVEVLTHEVKLVESKKNRYVLVYANKYYVHTKEKDFWCFEEDLK